MKKMTLILLALIMSGCSVKYIADPADELTSYAREICVIERTDVREEFLAAYKKYLLKKGLV